MAKKKSVGKKFLKLKIALGLASLFATIICIILICAVISTLFTALLGNKAKGLKTTSYESQIQAFEITGTKNSNTYNMNFSFPEWNINDIGFSLSGSSGSVSTTVKVPSLNGSNEQIVYQFFRKAGYTHEGTSGIMGCLWCETGGRYEPCAIEGDNAWTEGKTNLARGYGIAQWTNTSPPYLNGRRTKAVQWLTNNGYTPYTSSKELLQGQLQYILVESGYDYARNTCKKSTSIAQSCETWLTHFEGAYTPSYYSARLSKALEISQRYKNYTMPTDSFVDAKLDLTFTAIGNKVSFSGKLDGVNIVGSFVINNNSLSGTGYYGAGALLGGNQDGAYVGVESDSNSTQTAIVNSASKWSNPYNQGFAHLCESWVARVYRDAGLSYNGACCASQSRDKNSIKTGKIPVGAVIYSGSNYKSNVTCMCGKNAGHVAIYIGNGQVAGSQTPYKMPIVQWINLFGYGGWSFAGNNIK